MSLTQSVGILTSGGACPGLNKVIRAAGHSAQWLGYGCVGFLRGYEGLVDPISYLPLKTMNIALVAVITTPAIFRRSRWAATPSFAP